MRYPALTIPQQMFGSDLLDRHQTSISEHQLALCNAGELGLLALLPQVSVLPMLGYHTVEHARCRGTVDVTVLCKDIHAPGLPCEPGKHPCFYCREVRNNEPISVSGDECSTDQL